LIWLQIQLTTFIKYRTFPKYMKFSHLADCHIGSWREPRLRDISIRAFEKAIDISLSENVDFILISGDLFNTSMPAIDKLKETVVKLKEIKDKGIPVYAIAGSHDYSPSGKTMLEVLEGAGLLVNVGKGEIIGSRLRLRFAVDKKTGVKITGVLGKRAGLEKHDYSSLMKEELERESGEKIFMFHSAVSEMMENDISFYSLPMDFFPKGFDYYAGGHVHIVKEKFVESYGRFAYPGPLFPNSFSEIEELGRGGFYIVEDFVPKWFPIEIFKTASMSINCNDKTPKEAENEILANIAERDFANTIVTIRLDGVLSSGKSSDIDMQGIFSKLYLQGAYFVMKNTHALSSKEFERVEVTANSAKGIEDELIRKHLGQIKIAGFDENKEEELVKRLMEILNKEKDEGERIVDFESRLRDEIERMIDFALMHN